MRPSDFRSAAEDRASDQAAGVPAQADAIVNSGDAGAAYAKEFLEGCSCLDDDTLFDVRVTLRQMKDFKVQEFDRRIKNLRMATMPVNGHAADGWKTMLLTTDKGSPRALLANAIMALRYAPEWKGVLGYDEMSRRTVRLRKGPFGELGNWSDVDDIRLAEWLQHQGILVGSKIAFEAVSAVSMEISLHPVRNYLKSLKWDGDERISLLLADYFGAEASALNSAMSAKWMVSAVARVMNPSCQVDTCLVIEGPQGIRKSTGLRELTGNDDWFTDQVSELFSSKDASQDLLGKWIIEIKEIDKLSNHEMGVVKGFMDRRIDHYRPSYGRRSDDFPRHNVFGATTNKREWAVDETGGRRWWSAWCVRVNLSAIIRDRNQLWAEAFTKWQDGLEWWLPDDMEAVAKEEQRSRLIEDAWHPEIMTFIDEMAEAAPSKFSPGSVSVQEILLRLGIKLADFDKGVAARVARCLISDDWERYRESHGDRPWRYRRPLVQNK